MWPELALKTYHSLLVYSLICWAICFVVFFASKRSQPVSTPAQFNRPHIQAALLIAITGLVYNCIMWFYFAFSSQFNPIFIWIVENYALSKNFKPLLITADVIQHIIIALPIAWLIHSVRPRHYLFHCSLIVLPMFVWTKISLLESINIFQEWPSFYIGWLVELLIVPVTLLMVHYYKD